MMIPPMDSGTTAFSDRQRMRRRSFRILADFAYTKLVAAAKSVEALS